VIVFDDVDVDAAATLSAAAKFRNAGQICVSPTRFIVHDAVHDEFVHRMSEIARAMPVGDGLDSASKMGPVANVRRIDAMHKLIGDAEQRGARIAAGGRRSGNHGYFWQPTILDDVPEDAEIMSTEPFGPVAAITRFTEFDEAVQTANRLPYGLAAYAFTNSVKIATAIADALQAGVVGVNQFAIAFPESPFGGVKESGYGSEGGIEGMEAYLATKFVSQA